MTLHHPRIDEGAKSVAEHVVCFGSAVIGLTACAVALQWLLQTFAG